MSFDDTSGDPPNELRKQLETDRSGSGSGRPPSKTAVGTGGSGDFYPPADYTPGQQLKCKIVGVRADGYDVIILSDGVRGFLRSDKKHALGTILTSQFHSYQ